MNTVTPSSQRVTTASRRRLLQAGAASAALGLLGAPAIVRAQSGPKIRIGYWPIAAGLPFYSAIELGYFKEAGLDVEALKFAGAQQVMEAHAVGSLPTAAPTAPARPTSPSARSPSPAPSRSSAPTPAT